MTLTILQVKDVCMNDPKVCFAQWKLLDFIFQSRIPKYFARGKDLTRYNILKKLIKSAIVIPLLEKKKP